MNFKKLFGKKGKEKTTDHNRNHDEYDRVLSHREPIHSATVLSVNTIDTTKIISGSQDRSIVLYDFVNHRVLRRWTGHEHDVVKVIFSPVLNLIVSSSRDQTIRFWNAQSDTPVKNLHGHELVVTGIALNPTSTRLFSGSRDNRVIFWDIQSCQNLKTIQIGRNLVTDVKWSHDGSFVIQTSEDKETKIYDANTMTQVVSFPKKQYIQMSCDISNDNRYLITTSNGFNNSGGEISIWDIRQRKLLGELNGHRASVNCARYFDSVSSMIISCSNDGRAIVWDSNQLRLLCEIEIDNATPLTSLAPIDEQRFVTSELNGRLCFIQRTNNQLKIIDQI